MSEDRSEQEAPDTAREAAPENIVSTRRQLLMGGAVAASAIVSIRPALASTAASVLNCSIPVPDPGRGSAYVAPDGQVVPPGTQGAFPATPK